MTSAKDARVLVVDDEENIRVVLRTLLRRNGYEVEVASDVEEALAKVPEVFRMTVILSDLEGLSYDEVAEATDVPVGTVRSRIARGRAILRRELEQYAMENGYIKPNEI